MGDIFMSQDEGKIYHYFEQVIKKSITLAKASTFLGVSYRHAKRLWKEYKDLGIKGITSKKRGMSSHKKIPDKRRKEIAKIIFLHYPDFKPTLAKEMLKERHNIFLSKETVRKIMIEHNLWFAQKVKNKFHQRRKRCECFGELVQTDASDHLWFEDRGLRCHLYIIIDDATSRIEAAYFEEEETTHGYFKTFEIYLNKIGRPLRIYCDKRSTFKVNQKGEHEPTQFRRAMNELGIEITFAHSPQAKGRVERAFRTLQDRLIKEMRLQHISTIEEGNKFLPEFLEKHNHKFAEAPASSFNAHRPLDNEKPLKYILCWKNKRVVSKNLELSFEGETYQIQGDKAVKNLKNAQIEVLITLEGEMRLEHHGEEISFKKYNELPYKIPEPLIRKNRFPKKQIKKNQSEITKTQNDKFSKVIEIRGYFDREEIRTKTEKRVVELRLQERQKQSREDNKEILGDKRAQGDII